MLLRTMRRPAETAFCTGVACFGLAPNVSEGTTCKTMRTRRPHMPFTKNSNQRRKRQTIVPISVADQSLRTKNRRMRLGETIDLLQRLPRRPLRRAPRRALPRGAGRARGRVLHPGRVESRPPATVVVLRQLQVEDLAVDPTAT